MRVDLHLLYWLLNLLMMLWLHCSNSTVQHKKAANDYLSMAAFLWLTLNL